MVLGKPMMQAMQLGKADRSVKIHTLKLSDGTSKSFDTGKWGVTSPSITEMDSKKTITP